MWYLLCLHVPTLHNYRQRLIEWSKQQQCNILLMQETHFSQNIENKLIQEFKGSLYQSNGTSISCT
jgi:exonuclease III